MRPQHEYEEATRWIAWGLNDCQISRLTGLPRRTIQDWRAKPRTERSGSIAGCPRCSDSPLDEEAYSYLLGLYLGDGCLSEHARGVFRLRVTLDQRYPGIIDECRRAIDRVRAGTHAHVQQREGCVDVGSSWRHWPCMFPQHGPGRKHLRKIELSQWQKQIVVRYPAQLLRGLIHSDGWRGWNNVKVRGRSYAYPRYQFSNHSDDIRELFCRVCDDYGVGWRRMKWDTISVAKRADVAKLDEVIGIKR